MWSFISETSMKNIPAESKREVRIAFEKMKKNSTSIYYSLCMILNVSRLCSLDSAH
jgi:hypothetical protein